VKCTLNLRFTFHVSAAPSL